MPFYFPQFPIYTPAGKFELTQQGEVQLKDTVDRETLDAYTLTVEVSDTGVQALTTTVTLVIQITGISPTFFFKKKMLI